MSSCVFNKISCFQRFPEVRAFGCERSQSQMISYRNVVQVLMPQGVGLGKVGWGKRMWGVGRGIVRVRAKLPYTSFYLYNEMLTSPNSKTNRHKGLSTPIKYLSLISKYKQLFWWHIICSTYGDMWQCTSGAISETKAKKWPNITVALPIR